MRLFNLEIIPQKKKETRDKLRKYRKNYKQFTFSVRVDDYDKVKEYFDKNGGFAKWIKSKMQDDGFYLSSGFYKKVDSLEKVS